MSNKTAGLSGHALRSLFGTLTAPGTVAPNEAAAAASSTANLAANELAAPYSTPPLVVNATRPPGLPQVLPAGTVIVVSQAPKPTAVSSPVYEFPPGPGTLVAAIPGSLPVSPATRNYDFPAPEQPAADVIAAGSSNLMPQTAAPAVYSPGAQTTPISPAINPPARPTLVVPATPARPTTTVGPDAASNSIASIEATAPARTANAAADSGASAAGPAPIPTPPPAAVTNASLNGMGTGIAITDILRLAAQLSADRLAPAVPGPTANNGAPVDDALVKELRDRLLKEIEELYQKTIVTVGDSPAVVAYCLDLLKKARLALLTGSTAEDLSQAEFYVEEVRSKLSRSQDPIPPGEMLNVAGLLVWSVGFWILCLPLALLPWFAPTGQIAMWNIKIPVEMIPLLATVGWGGTGGVIGTLYNMTWFVQMREYDPAYNLDYFLRPIKGFIAGGVMMLIFTAGISTLNGPQAALGSDKASLGFAMVYLGAALAGFKQEYVYEWFDSILKVFFRTPPATPKQLDAQSK
jgi:hypothetical protein